ncbi:MAG: DUF6377 domain-containing protein [Saprospiraceae bacterium]
MLKTIFTFGVFLVWTSMAWGQSNLEALLNRLDKTIEASDAFIKAKETRIDSLRNLLEKPKSDLEDSYSLYNQLYEEYKAYRFDSALHYVYANIELSKALQKQDWMDKTKLNLSAILTTTGMYKESIDNLNSIEKNQLPAQLYWRYYLEHKLAYEALNQYALDGNYAPSYYLKANTYQDSLLQSLTPNSNDYLLESGVMLIKEGKLKQAEKIYLDLCLNRLKPATAIYAKATATLANIYEQEGEELLQKQYLILSAMADIQAVVKENASLTKLAIQLFEEGEIDRANRYIEYALADANFYNARQRKVEISKVYPIINRAYQLQIEKQKDTLRFYLLFITAISILLVITLIAIYLQNQKLYRTRQNLHQLNQELHQVNTRLNESNQRLQEANYIKEEYIGHFLNQCSVYIDKLESYQKVVRKKVMTKELNALMKMTDSTTFMDAELKEFYANFDRAFLRLYPDFVNEFNSLLDKNQQIVLKNGELLTTELRIFALIRLGINDSYKIAHFLRYSVNTIYNYRAQIKNKSSVERDHFEHHVMNIGSFYNDN